MKFIKISPLFFAQRIGKATKFTELKKTTRQLILFSFCLFFFLGATELPLKGEVDYLEKMGVMRIDETAYAPNFVLPDVEGKKISLSKYHGKFVMLNFWATW